MDDMRQILKDRVPEEPPELDVLKRYFKERYDETVVVTVRRDEITVLVSSAALATTLRLRSREIQSACRISKRLRFTLV